MREVVTLPKRLGWMENTGMDWEEETNSAFFVISANVVVSL